MSAGTQWGQRCAEAGHMLAWRYQAEPPTYAPHCLHCGVALDREPDQDGQYHPARPEVDHLMVTMDPSTGATPLGRNALAVVITVALAALIALMFAVGRGAL